MQSRSSLILSVAALAAAISLTWLAVRTLAPRERDAGPGAASEPPARALRGERSAAPAPPASAGDRDHRAAAEVIDPSTAATEDGELVEVEIVRGDTRAPVTRADVWWWPEPAAPEGGSVIADWLRASELEAHEDEALHLRSDPDGRVRVPRAPGRAFVAARSGNLWGSRALDADVESRAVVELAPDVEVRVAVVDSHGAPVSGATVALRRRRLARTSDALTAVSAAPDGIAVLRHAGLALGAGDAASADLAVALRGLFEPPVERRIVLDEVVELVLPPSGSCEVAVVDARGRTVGGPRQARLRFADSAPRAGSPAAVERIAARADDAVIFEHVALGRALDAEVTLEGSNTVLAARGPGPRAPGERVRLEIPVGDGVAILRGRAVDSAGVAVSGARLRARLESTESGGAYADARPVTTSADGSFSLDVEPIEAEQPGGLALALSRLSDDGAEIAAGRAALSSELTAGAHDVGDVALIETPLAAAGIVVGEGGAFVARALVVPELVIELEADGAPSRAAPSLAPVRSDGRGRFEVRGAIRGHALVLTVRKGDLVAGPVQVEVGARDVRLRLRAAATIEGTLLLDPSLAAGALLVEAVRDDGSHTPHRSVVAARAVPERDGRFTIAGLPAGSFTLRIAFAATGAELARVAGIAVRAGEAARDPRLDPLDVRGARVIELELADGHGAPIRNARAYSRPSGDPDARWTYSQRGDGRLQFLIVNGPLDVVVAAGGYLRAELERVGESRRITMRRAARLRLALAPDVALPEAPLALCAELTPVDIGPTGGLVGSTGGCFDARGVLACESEVTGELRIALWLRVQGADASQQVYLEAREPRALHVEALAGEQAFEVEVDAAALDAAVRTLRGER